MRAFFVSIVTMMLIFSCKPMANSEIKSLENFAAGKDIRKNKCRADQARKNTPFQLTESQIVSPSSSLTKAAIQAAGALPADVRRVFTKLKGKVRISNDAVNICGKLVSNIQSGTALNYDPPQKIQSCAVLLEGNASRGQTFEIVLQADKANIEHQLVRQFGLVAAQTFSRLGYRDVNGQKEFFLSKKHSTDFTAAKFDLAAAFLKDIYATHLFSMKSFDRFIGADKLRLIERNLAAGAEDPFQGLVSGSNSDVAYNHSEISSFSDYVFAEAFDSYYCRRDGKYDRESMLAMIAGDLDKQKSQQVISAQENSLFVMYDLFSQSFEAFARLDRIINPTSNGLPRMPQKHTVVSKLVGKDSSQGFSLRKRRGGWPGGWWNPGNWMRGVYTGDPNAADNVYEAATTAAGESVHRNLGKVHTGLDAVGVVDPTGIADGLNAGIYAVIEGDRSNAAISMAGIIPFVGDAAKVGRYGKMAVKYSDEVNGMRKYSDEVGDFVFQNSDEARRVAMKRANKSSSVPHDGVIKPQSHSGAPVDDVQFIYKDGPGGKATTATHHSPDPNHPLPHWEVGRTKDPIGPNARTDGLGRFRYEGDKVKVHYDQS